jgi:hypothetical protein
MDAHCDSYDSKPHMKSIADRVHAVLVIPYFPLLDSVRVYKQHGWLKAMRWFLVRLLVPFGLSQKRRGNSPGVPQQLCTTGYATMPARTTAEVAELVGFFLQQKAAAESANYRTPADYFDYWRAQSILRPAGLSATGRSDCPITRLSREPSITDIVCEYLKLPPARIRVQGTIDALVRVGSNRVLIAGYDGAVEFHRDIDSWKWVKYFLYLTDTFDGDGHHEVFARSHLRTPLSLVAIRRYAQTEVAAAMPEATLSKMCGPAGHTFMENTFAFHRGTVPTRHDRLILTLSYYDDSVVSWMFPGDTYSI